MRTSTEIGSISTRIGEEKAVEAVASAGFDCWDFTMLNMAPVNRSSGFLSFSYHPLCGDKCFEFAKRLKRIGEDNGITCNQSHAPYPTAIPAVFDLLERALECTALAGGKICVIHPQNNGTLEQNVEMYKKLLPFAKSCGVKIATENMWNWDHACDRATDAACSTGESFSALVDAVNDPYLVACLDVGHSEMMQNTSAPLMIEQLGSRIHALHLHDNDKWHDSHMIPFAGKMDFNAITAALKRIGYSGDVTLEANTHVLNVPVENISAELRKMADAAKRLAAMIESAN